MPRPKGIPKLHLHKSSGRARVTIDTKDYYCGAWDPTANAPSAAAIAEYDRVIAGWLARGRRTHTACVDGITIAELCSSWLEFASSEYRGASLGIFKAAIQPLVHLYAAKLARDFGPMDLKSVRAHIMSIPSRQPGIRDGRDKSRNYVNELVRRIKSIFKWATHNEMIPGSVYHSLFSLPRLRFGSKGVRETDPIGPVDDKDIDVVLPLLSRQLRAMVQFQ